MVNLVWKVQHEVWEKVVPEGVKFGDAALLCHSKGRCLGVKQLPRTGGPCCHTVRRSAVCQFIKLLVSHTDPPQVIYYSCVSLSLDWKTEC